MNSTGHTLQRVFSCSENTGPKALNLMYTAPSCCARWRNNSLGNTHRFHSPGHSGPFPMLGGVVWRSVGRAYRLWQCSQLRDGICRSFIGPFVIVPPQYLIKRNKKHGQAKMMRLRAPSLAGDYSSRLQRVGRAAMSSHANKWL